MVGDLFKTAADPFIGRKLDGRYEVLGRLGEGGAGVVYRGRQTQLGRFVAIKVLHQDAAAIPEWRRRFEREARALSALAHPNVVSITDSGIDQGVPYLVMELLQGKTLADLIRLGSLPLWRALDIVGQTLRGLAFAHGKGIVHRDLKPANIFLQALPDQADHVRLLDFGMVKFLEASSRTVSENLTHAGVLIGTPAYMSPEQIKAAAVDARTDVYSAGVVLFELLAGRRPFEADSYEGYMGAHLTQPIPSLAELRPELAAAAPVFQPVIQRAMEKKPSARFKDAAAMLAALEAAADKLPVAASGGGRGESRRRSAPHARLAAPPGARSGRRAIVGAALAAAIAAGGAYLWREWAKPAETAALAPAPASKRAAKSPPQKAALPPLPPRPAAPASPLTAASPPIAPSPPIAAAPPPPPPKPEPSQSAAAPSKAAEPTKPVAQNEAPSEPSEEPASAEEPERSRQPRPRARNPWQGPVPRPLKSIRAALDRGAHLSQRALRPAYDFAHQNPGDPRPWLLLGRAYAQVDWYSDAVDRYVHANRIDSTSRGDPQMLADLLKAAAHPVAGRNAARAIRDIYGPEAIPALDKAMKLRAGEHEAAARLARLRESLR